MLKLKQILCSIFIVSSLFSYSVLWAQESGKVNVASGQISLKNLIQEIEKQTDYTFVFDNSIPLSLVVSIKGGSENIQVLLRQALGKSDIKYEIVSKQIILRKDPEKSERLITGTVKDEHGEAVIGASVKVKNSTVGTITDMDGNFSLQVPGNAEVEISFVGCMSQQVKVGNKKNLQITLKEDAQNLEEVVVIGYGTQKKKDLTSAIATISTKELSNQTVSNAVAAIQGRLSGVQVTNSGSPGSSPSIRIRGTGSVHSANPIYVVDGMIVDDISYLGPNDIESMSVLKDASASAIYGVRAANGVIMVSTKRGAQTGKIKVDLNAYVGIKKPSHIHEMVSGPEYVTLYNEYMKYTDNEQGMIDPANFTYSNDWFREVLTNSFTCNEDITIRGGNDRSIFSVGVNHLKENGLVESDHYEKLGLRANYEFKINKAVTTGLNLVVSSTKANPISGGLLSSVYKTVPLLPTREQNGGEFANPENVNGFDTMGNNPEATLFYNHQWQNTIKALISGFVDVKLFDSVTLRSTLGFNPSYGSGVNYAPKYEISSRQKHATNDLSKSSSNNMSLSWDNTLTYEKVFAQAHSLKIMVGYSYREAKTNSLTGSAEDIIDIPDINQSYLFLTIGKGSKYTMKVSDSGSRIVQIGYLGRVTYDYKHRYLLNATLRSDASSKFPSHNRRGYFPSVGLGWVISEEAFMKNSGIDFMKLRVGWGLLGNDNIPSNLYQLSTSKGTSIIFGPDQNSGLGSGVSSAVTVNKQFNPDLRWEVVDETNVGLDINFFNNRLATSLDWYYKLTKDAIFATTALGSSGLSSSGVWGNFANILNTGFEFSASWNDRIGDFSYNIGANFTYNKNKVKKISAAGASYYDKGDDTNNIKPLTRTRIGHAVGEFFGYKAIGVFQNQEQIDKTPHMNNTKPGMLIFEDVNGDGTIDASDRTALGNPNPPFIYGFNLGGSYKDFDLNIFCQGVAGNKIYNENRALMTVVRNYDKDFYDHRWTGEGTSNTYPSVVYSAGDARTPNSFFVESGSYFRIKSIQFGYSLPKSALSKLHIEKLRLYLNAENPVTFFKYNGFSPEVSSSDPLMTGVNNGAYPLSSVYSFGINVTF